MQIATAAEIVDILRGGPEVRRLHERDCRIALSFFRSRIEPLIERAAQRHPLGFIYASEEVSQGVKLRYHLWPNGWRIPETQAGSETHDHAYELNSLVIGGALRHETFEVMPETNGDHEIWEVVYSSEASTLRPTQVRVALRQMTDQIHEAGTAYRLPPGIIHRASAVSTPAATMVLTIDNEMSLVPRVVIGVGRASPDAFTRRRLMEDEIAAAFELLDRL